MEERDTTELFRKKLNKLSMTGYAKTEFMGYQWNSVVWGLDVREFYR